MKTNKLMTAVALSAMFAACTQNAELDEALAKKDFSDVPMVEAEFTVDTSVDSRMTNKFGWEEGDIVGFAWTGKAAGDGTLSGEAWANFPLYCQNAANQSFGGNSSYYVGSYFAYMPYSEDTKDIAYIPFSIKGQPLTSNANDLAKKAILISPKMTVLTAETAGRNKNYPLAIKQLTNAATINLAFKNATSDLKVTKVELNLYDESRGEHNPGMLTSFGYKPKTWTEDAWTEVAPETFRDDNTVANTYSTLELVDEKGLTLDSDMLTVYALTMPATLEVKYMALEVKVTTNKGVVTVKDAKVAAENDVEKAEKIGNNTPLFTKFGQTGVIFATVDMQRATGIDTEAADQTELESIIADWITMGKAEEDLTVTLKPATANDEKTFELTDFAIPADYKGTLTLTTDKANAETIVFNGTTTIDKDIEVLSPAVIKNEMTVGEEVTWRGSNESVTLTIDNGGTLINNGVLATYVKTVAATDDNVAGKYIHNGRNAGLTVKLNNLGESQWMPGASEAPSVVSGTNFVYAEVLTVDEIKAANEARVYEIHLMDGARIMNNTEAAVYNFAWVVKCYGHVTIHVTDSYNSSTPQILNIAGDQSSLCVTEGASVVISSDNKQNEVNAGRNVYVEGNASLSVNNVIYNANVKKNEGSVITYNTTGFNK